MSEQVLIISYTFPPTPGIGGRRWAKFAKYFALKGYRVQVICATNPFSDTSIWDRDTLSENIIKVFVPHKYPGSLLGVPQTILQRLK